MLGSCPYGCDCYMEFVEIARDCCHDGYNKASFKCPICQKIDILTIPRTLTVVALYMTEDMSLEKVNAVRPRGLFLVQ